MSESQACAKASGSGVSRTARSLDVRCFGAVGDDRHDDAPAFRAAFKALAETGGEVRAPAGVYRLASVGDREEMNMRYAIELCSGCTLRIERGAVLRIADNFIQRGESTWGAGVILAADKHDVSVLGPGEVDLNGPNNLVRSGQMRPGYAVKFWACKNQVIRDVTFRNASGRDVVFITGNTENRPGDRAFVLGNTFLNGGTSVPGNVHQDDFSAIYVDSTNAEIAHNKILHETYPVTYSGGIEIHNSATHCHDNFIERSFPAIYLASDHIGTVVSDIFVRNNLMKESQTGIQFFGPGQLRNVEIVENEIEVRPFVDPNRYPGWGIRHLTDDGTVESGSRSSLVENYLVAGNTIHGDAGRVSDAADTYGIKIAGVHQAQILGNRIFDLSGSAILLWSSPTGLRQLLISSNILQDFGRNRSEYGHSGHLIYLHPPEHIDGTKDTFKFSEVSVENESVNIATPVEGVTYSAFQAEWSESHPLTSTRVVATHSEGVTQLALGERAQALMVTQSERNASKPRVTADRLVMKNTRRTAVDDLVDGVEGQTLTIVLDRFTKLVHGARILTADGRDVVGSATSRRTISLKRVGGVWRELSRSF